MQHPHPHAGYVPQPVLPSPVSRSSDVLALFVRLVCLSLSLSMHESALFIAERYACLCPNSEEAVFYHSLALLRSGQARMALETLRLATAVTTSTSDVVQASVGRRAQEQLKPAIEASLRCAWVYAEACIKLDRAQEGAEVLRKASKLHTGNSSSNNKSAKLNFPEQAPTPSVSSSPAAISLAMAKMAAKANKPDVAAQQYEEVLKSAWWCWEAYEGLCKLGRAPDPETTFADIPVPVVVDAERQEEPPPASFLAAQPMSAQNSRSGSTGLNNKPSFGQLRAAQSTTTPTFAFGKFKSQLAPLNGVAEGSQGAGFRFGDNAITDAQAESQDAEESNGFPARGASTGAGGLSVSLDDIPIGDGSSGSSFFAAAGPGPGLRKKGQQTAAGGGGASGGGGLFGLGAGPSGIPQLVKRKSSAPMFGTSLLLGQSSTSAQNATATGGSFFTPPSAAAAEESSNGAAPHRETARAGPSLARAHPHGGKRNRVDSEPQRPVAGALNGGGSGDDSMDAQDQDSLDTKIDIMHRNGVDAGVHAAPRKGGLARRSTRITGAAPANGASASAATAAAAANARRGGMTAMTAKVPNRPTSNPRDRKRSKAGPSSYDDTASETHSFESASQNGGGGLHPGTSSSSPPASHSQLENIPPFSLRYGTVEPPHNNAARSSMAISVSSSNGMRGSHPPLFASSATSYNNGPAAAASQQMQPSLSAAAHATYKAQVKAAQQALAENYVRGLFRNFAKVYSGLSRYDYTGVLRDLLALPQEQTWSARALNCLGVAHFQSLHYEQAVNAFNAAREAAPCSVENMDLYSTALWHLHKPTELSFLAQEIMNVSPLLPQAWIAVGNVFSHLEDHVNALRSFKRAIQCDSTWTYAYTLAGHESVTLEEWDPAIGFFRDAIQQEPRHYNAWFGLGNVYMKLGKYRLAEYHFRKAIEINASNAMLVSCVGSVLEKQDRKKEALEMYERACLLAPHSPAVRFKRVKILMETKQYDAALKDLLLVRDMAPDEFNVHHLLGKLYGAMGEKVQMTKNLTIAQDLEPRAAGRIREMIENAGRRAGSAGEEEEEDEGSGVNDTTGAADHEMSG